MVKVRILTSIAGEGFAWSEGEIVDMSSSEADVWADGERAVRLDAEQRPEAAVTRAPENAARRARRPEGRTR
jgi:hypothetical protein